MKLKDILEGIHGTAAQRNTESLIYDFNAKVHSDGDKLKNYSVLDNGELVIEEDFSIYSFSKITELPVKIHKVNALYCRGNKIKTLKNFPTYATEAINFMENEITSLVGINDIIKETQSIALSGNPITEGGLGLLLIDKLKVFTFDSDDLTCGPAFQIIYKYLGRPNDIFECQNELIEAGLDEFAQI